MIDPAYRLARLYALRDRLNAEIKAAERLVRQPPTQRRSRYEVPHCGTESAYQRHRYYGEKLDPATDKCGCLAAHAAHNREKDRQRKLRIRRAALGIVPRTPESRVARDEGQRAS